MPRQARLDAPETLHHVMVRGLERTAIFRDDTDRGDFLARLAALAAQGAWTVSAWALLPNHAHLLVQTGATPLAISMRRLLTGYVVNFNRRHTRVGQLVQNRYTSIGMADARILGSGAFVEQLLAEAAVPTRQTLRLRRPPPALETLAARVAAAAGLAVAELQGGRRTRAVSQARRLLCQVAVRHLGYAGAAVARVLGVTTSAVNRAAWTSPLSGVKAFLS